jgi:hypothetical protein
MGSMVSWCVGMPRSSRVLCASCDRLFEAGRPTTGDRVRCSHCREIVEVGAPVVRKSRRHSSRTSIASWMDEPRSAGSEAMMRAAICAALVAGVLLLIATISGHAPPPEHLRGLPDQAAGALEFGDSGEW